MAEFLGSVPTASQVNVTKNISWGDECDREEIVSVNLPTAPRSTRTFDDNSIPREGPFIAYLSNLPYDLSDDELQQYFEETLECELVSVRLPRDDKEGGRMRGYGYATFHEREDLINAISLPDPQIRNRRIRIDVSNENDQKRNNNSRRGYDNFGTDGRGGDTNWRRDDGPRAPDEERGERRGGYGSYNRDRPPREEGQDSGNWRSEPRAAPESPPPQRRTFTDRGDRGDRIERSSGDRIERSSGDRIERGSNDRIERSGERMERGGEGGGFRENRDRFGGRRNNGYEERRRDEPVNEEDRPKLRLAPRTLPVPELDIKPEDEEKPAAEQENSEPLEEVQQAPRPKPVPAASIFGAAKPVDTAAKDRAIEERLEKARLEKKALEEKEKEKALEEREKEKEKENEQGENEKEQGENKKENETEKDEKVNFLFNFF